MTKQQKIALYEVYRDKLIETYGIDNIATSTDLTNAIQGLIGTAGADDDTLGELADKINALASGGSGVETFLVANIDTITTPGFYIVEPDTNTELYIQIQGINGANFSFYEENMDIVSLTVFNKGNFHNQTIVTSNGNIFSRDKVNTSSNWSLWRSYATANFASAFTDFFQNANLWLETGNRISYQLLSDYTNIDNKYMYNGYFINEDTASGIHQINGEDILILEVTKIFPNKYQRALTTAGKMYFRTHNNTSWSTWEEITGGGSNVINNTYSITPRTYITGGLTEQEVQALIDAKINSVQPVWTPVQTVYIPISQDSPPYKDYSEVSISPNTYTESNLIAFATQAEIAFKLTTFSQSSIIKIDIIDLTNFNIIKTFTTSILRSTSAYTRGVVGVTCGIDGTRFQIITYNGTVHEITNFMKDSNGDYIKDSTTTFPSSYGEYSRFATSYINNMIVLMRHGNTSIFNSGNDLNLIKFENGIWNINNISTNNNKHRAAFLNASGTKLFTFEKENSSNFYSNRLYRYDIVDSPVSLTNETLLTIDIPSGFSGFNLNYYQSFVSSDDSVLYISYANKFLIFTLNQDELGYSFWKIIDNVKLLKPNLDHSKLFLVGTDDKIKIFTVAQSGFPPTIQSNQTITLTEGDYT